MADPIFAKVPAKEAAQSVDEWYLRNIESQRDYILKSKNEEQEECYEPIQGNEALRVEYETDGDENTKDRIENEYYICLPDDKDFIGRIKEEDRHLETSEEQLPKLIERHYEQVLLSKEEER